MSSEWEVYQLDELCEFINGFAFKSTDYVESSAETVEVFRMGYISRGGGFKEDNTPVFIPKKYGKNLDKYLLRHGDVTIAMTDMKDKVAILGNTAWIPQSDRFVLNQRVGCIRVKRPDLLDPRFFYFYSNSKPHVEYLRTRANSGVQVNLSTSAIKESQIQIPPLSTQIEIAETLGSIDDRIALLRETNATLEAIAQALFKSWFVDFDPVHANHLLSKVEGQPGSAPPPGGRRAVNGPDGPTTALPAGLDEATAALFPDSFEESELGLVPKGWSIRPISEVVEGVYDGPHATPPESEEGPIFLGIKNLTGTGLNLTEVRHIHEDQWSQWTRRVTPRSGDIVFSYEATLGFFALIPPDTRCCLGRRLALIRPLAKEGCGHFWFHQFISAPFQRLLDKHTIPGATVNRIALKQFPSYPVLNPPTTLRLIFESSVSSLWKKIHANQQQAQTLAILRDTLLPRLISGQLRLPEAEAMLKQV